MRRKGFTLIEMLIVIAVIGVLAVAVLSAINPIEQMRKARDTRRRSNAAELLNALERYYATHETYPSAFTAAAAGNDVCASAVGNTIPAASLSDLVTSNELKPDFTTRMTTAEPLYAGVNSSTALVRVCYQIEAKANMTSSACTIAGGNVAACVP